MRFDAYRTLRSYRMYELVGLVQRLDGGIISWRLVSWRLVCFSAGNGSVDGRHENLKKRLHKLVLFNLRISLEERILIEE